jgi:abortive infection bacteriophage resistance protein
MRIYNITAKSPSKKAVTDYFGIKETVFTTWLHALVYVRNICAHHARLWNKELRIPVKLPRKTANKWLSTPNLTDRKVYIVLAILVYLLDTITPHHTFRQKIKGLVKKYPDLKQQIKKYPGYFMAVGNHIPDNTPVDNVLYYNDAYEKLSKR